MRRVLSIALVVVLLASAVMSTFWYQYRQFLQTPLSIENAGMIVTVEPGTNIRSVLAVLEKQGVTRLDWRWRLLNRLRQGTIKTGEYELKPGVLPEGLLDLLASGKVVSYRFTIVEGWTVKQLLAALGANPVLKQSIQDLADIDQLDGLPASNPEGWFLPETYAFVRGDSDLKILRRAYKDMQTGPKEVWAGRDTGLPYETPYELMIMASIIEKETSMEGERAEIAGVFVRRLLQCWR